MQSPAKRLFVPIATCLLLSAFAEPSRAQVSAPTGGGEQEQIVTRAPALLHRVAAVYPEEAKSERLAGRVVMRLTIGVDGTVTDVHVTAGAGHGFDAAAVVAARQFLFSPAEINGHLAPVEIEYTENFAYVVPPPPVATKPLVLPISLRGTVRERATRIPLTQAAVRVRVGDIVLPPVVVDPNGAFDVRSPPGVLTVEVLDGEHVPFKTQETIGPDEQLQVTYYLMPKSIGTFESVVHSQRDKKEVTRRTLRREELQSVPGSFGDALRVIENLPGLARTPYSVGGLIVRGAPAADTGTYFAGVQVPLLFHFGGGPSVLNSEFIDRIDFFPGNFGSRYGRAIGGILDIDARPAKIDGLHGSGQLNFLDASVYLAQPLTQTLTLSLAARRSYVDAILGPVLSAAGSATVILPAYYDYQARLTYQPKLSRHRFEAFFMGSNDLLKVITAPSDALPFQLNVNQGFQRLMGAWTYIKGDVRLKSMGFFGYDENSIGVGSLKVDTPATVGGMREDLEVSLTPHVVLRAGLDAQLRQQGVNFASRLPLNYDPFPGGSPDAPLQTIFGNTNQLDVAEYIELEAKWAMGLTLLPSFRLDTFHATGKTQMGVGPRLSVRYALGGAQSDTAIKAAVGLMNEQTPAQQTNPVVGNPALGLQRAMQLSAGAEHRFTDYINLDATVFWSARSDLAVATQATFRNAQNALVPLRFAATGIGNAYGLEVFLRHEMSKHVFAWLAYTLAWSQQRDAMAQPWYPTSFDQRHILTLIGQYRFNSGWEVGGRFRLVSGSPTTPIVDHTYSADTQGYTALYGAQNSARLAVFHQLDLRIDKIWLFKTWQIGVYLDIQNIYDRQNADFIQYDYRYVGAQTIPDIPILPTLGVKGTF